jgi:hypothetical protein
MQYVVEHECIITRILLFVKSKENPAVQLSCSEQGRVFNQFLK